MKKYLVIYEDREENEYRFEIEAFSPENASIASYSHNSDEVDGYKEIRVIEL